MSPGGEASAGAPVAEGDQRAAVLAAYRGFFREFERALATNDAGGLGGFAAAGVERRVAGEVREQARARVVKRQHSALNPKVAWVTGEQAEVIDCVVASGLTSFDARSGRRLKNGVPERGVLQARLVVRDGGWKVVALNRVRPSC